MIDRAYVDYLKVLHGLYNTLVACFFIYQASLGWRIRKERKAGGERNFQVLKRHRQMGPVLALLGLGGYFAGIMLVYIDRGHLLEYPRHLAVGSGLALFIAATFIISRQIKGPESPWRTPHFLIGVIILLLYGLQVFIGLDILL